VRESGCNYPLTQLALDEIKAAEKAKLQELVTAEIQAKDQEMHESTNIVYVTNKDDNTVSVIDGKTNNVITDIKVGRDPSAVSVNPSTNIVYVANTGDS
jgi:YVTN family beta-propeller protein